MSERDPFQKYPKKLKDSTKRDFLVKKLKKEREDLHFERLRRQQEEDDEEVEEYCAPERAGAIVLVKQSYLHQNLSQMNNAQKDQLPKKWSKSDAKVQEEEEEDEDDYDDEDYEDDDYDDEDYEDEDDVDDEAKLNKLRNSALPVYEEESDDNNDDEHEFTSKKVVQIIEAFNEIETIEANSPGRRYSHDYDGARTMAPRSMREKSKSPRLTPRQSPRHTPNSKGMVNDDELAPLSLNNSTKSSTQVPSSQQQQTHHGHAMAEKKQRELAQQLEDLDFDAIINKKDTTGEPSLLPHEDELDTGVWWRYILENGATIKKDGSFSLQIVKYFPPAKDHDIPEDYFHLPIGRKSPPEKALTAFGLFKKHKLTESDKVDDKAMINDDNNDDVDGNASTDKKKRPKKAKKQPKHSKTRKASQSSSPKPHLTDGAIKTMFHQLPDDELIDYYVLALIEKIRYKCQRVEYVYQQSTQIQGAKRGGKKDKV